MALIVDAGPLVAYVQTDSRAHDACRTLLERHRGPLFIPTLVVAEAAYMLGRRLGTFAELSLIRDISAGTFIVEHPDDDEWSRIAELVHVYGDLPLGTVDASVVSCAERLKVTTIATLDRKDFSVVRPRHCESFTLLP